MRKSPFFARQLPLCESMRWTLWSGYYAAQSYLLKHDLEYFALRTAVGLIDVSPLCKYLITGPASRALLSRVMVRDFSHLAPGRVAYTCWCDQDGFVIGDGTVICQADDRFLLTSTDPSCAWLNRQLRGLNAEIRDVSHTCAALALQGPASREVLGAASSSPTDILPYYHAVQTEIAGASVWISRTGYTGDLGYEIWMPAAAALGVWDAIAEAGAQFAMRPAGLKALDVCRIEAGLLLQHVDYHNALHALIRSRKSTPFELGLGWIVDLERPSFVGKSALRRLQVPKWKFVGLDIDWPETQALYEQHNLPPAVPSEAWRNSVPVYLDAGRQHPIGYATSGTWSPVLKKNIALATVASEFARGTVQIEATVEHQRHTVTAHVVSPRFFSPARKTRRFE